MCGLVGVFGNYVSQNDQDFFKDGLIGSQLRGQDSTGMSAIYGRNDYDIKTLKAAQDATAFVAREDVKKFFWRVNNVKVLLGHTRFATQGSVKFENAHPFHHEHILLAHNGGIYNKRDLPDGDKFQVDSEAICHSIAKIGAVKTLEKIHGDFALSYYDLDSEKFHLIRNDGRPLYIVKHKNKKAWYYASEGEMLFWLCRRNNIDLDKIMEIPKSTLYSFDLNTDELTTSKVDLERKRTAKHWEDDRQYWHQGRYIPNTPTAALEDKRDDNRVVDFPQKTTDRQRWRGLPGPHGNGHDFLRSWGLTIGDSVLVGVAGVEKVGKHTDACKALGFFADGVMEDAEIWIYNFTEKYYKEVKNEHDRYFSIVTAAWYNQSEKRYYVNFSGLYNNPLSSSRVSLPKDIYNKYEKKKETKTDEEKNEVVITEGDLQEMAERIAKAHAKDAEAYEQQKQSRIVGSDDEEIAPHIYVPGPLGGHIPYAKWEELTKEGCGYCCLPLTDPNDTDWVGNCAIHKDCQTAYAAEHSDRPKMH